MEGFKIMERQSLPRAPCPVSSPTQIGASKRYQVLCGVDLQGSDYLQFTATSLTACVQICTSYSTSCVAVAFEASSAHGKNNCYLKNSLPNPKQQTFVMDSAIALPNDVSNDCESLPKRSQVNGVWFETHCGMDYPRDDMPNQLRHTKSLRDCASLCASTQGCKAVSFEAAMTHGNQYYNCYMKTSGSPSELQQSPFDVDTALVVFGDFPVPDTPPSPVIPQPSMAAPSPIGSPPSAQPAPLPPGSVQVVTVTMAPSATVQPGSLSATSLQDLTGSTTPLVTAATTSSSTTISAPLASTSQSKSSAHSMHSVRKFGLILVVGLYFLHTICV